MSRTERQTLEQGGKDDQGNPNRIETSIEELKRLTDTLEEAATEGEFLAAESGSGEMLENTQNLTKEYLAQLAKVTSNAASNLTEFIAMQADATECACSQMQLILARLSLTQEQTSRDTLWTLEAQPRALQNPWEGIPLRTPDAPDDSNVSIQERLDKVEQKEVPSSLPSYPTSFAVKEAFEPVDAYAVAPSEKATHTVPEERPRHSSSRSGIPPLDELMPGNQSTAISEAPRRRRASRAVRKSSAANLDKIDDEDDGGEEEEEEQ